MENKWQSKNLIRHFDLETYILNHWTTGEFPPNHLIVYSAVPDFPDSNTIKTKPLNILIQSHRKEETSWILSLAQVQNVHYQHVSGEKTREKTHAKVIELFGLLSIFYYSENRCSKPAYLLSFPPLLPYCKQISNNGGGDGRTHACATGESGHKGKLVLKKRRVG